MVSLPPRKARFTMAIAALVGLFASAYLFYEYVTGGSIACALVSGCDVVRASVWAKVFGVPRPFFGLLYYAVLFQLLVIRAALTKWAKPLHAFTMMVSVVGFLESAVLFIVQWLDLKAFCFWCLLSGLSSTVIFFASLWDRPQREQSDEQRAVELRDYLWLLIGYIPLVMILFYRLVFWRP